MASVDYEVSVIHQAVKRAIADGYDLKSSREFAESLRLELYLMGWRVEIWNKKGEAPAP